MIPGSIFRHERFQFHDGRTGTKYFIVLGMMGDSSIIAVKTTSKRNNRPESYGCHLSHRYPSFHLPLKTCCLPAPTWVCLDEFYQLEAAPLLEGKFSGVVRFEGQLVKDTTTALINCAASSDDISPAQLAAIRTNP